MITRKRYSPVGPLPVLQFLKEHDRLGDYLLVLAHEVAADQKGYEELLEDFPKNGTLILDNGVVELGYAASSAELVAAIDVVDPDYFILPDAIGAAEDTVRGSYYMANHIGKQGFNGKFMGVPQGQSYPQIKWCIQSLAMDVGINDWGIPRWFTNHFGSRKRFVEAVGGGVPMSAGTNIHLLGMSQNLLDDGACAMMPCVRGIDSANPLVLAMNEIGLFEVGEYRHLVKEYKERYWNLKADPSGMNWDMEDLMLRNVDHIRAMINGDAVVAGKRY